MANGSASRHFLAALGLERLMEQAAHVYLRSLYRKILIEYGKEARYERAKAMRQSPMDYLHVRELDRALDEATARLQEIEFEHALRK